MAGQAGRLQGQDRSVVTCPSSSHARRCLIWLSCDNRRTHYTAPLAVSDRFSLAQSAELIRRTVLIIRSSTRSCSRTRYYLTRRATQ
ncbi:hypothetical protein J6590_093877 [Homalodisca vitripennis]|nr:hypothetical protein J6590_093877 [Homalodisca vitripennis]